MGLGEHRLQGAQPLRTGVDEQCEQGARPTSYEKEKKSHKNIFLKIILVQIKHVYPELDLGDISCTEFCLKKL